MTAQISVVSATKDEIESDITLIGDDGEPLAVFTGFTLQALSASSRMSPERVDKGLYEIQWVERSEKASDQTRAATSRERPVLVDLPRRRRRSEQRWPTNCAAAATASGRSCTGPSTQLTKVDGGYALNPQQPEQLHQLIELTSKTTVTLPASSTAGRSTSAPNPMAVTRQSGEMNDHLGVFTILHLVKAFAEHDAVAPRLYLLTANAQPVLGNRISLPSSRPPSGDSDGSVGHQEFANRWGGFIDIDDADDRTEDCGAHLRAHPRARPRGSDCDPGRHHVRSPSSPEHKPDTSRSRRSSRPTRPTWSPAEPEPSAASSPPTSPNAGRVISHCCPEARSRREISGRRCPTTTDTTRPSTRSARSSTSARR